MGEPDLPRSAALGAPISLESEPTDTEVADRTSDRARRAAQAMRYIRENLTLENYEKLRAIMQDPSLTMTVLQQDLLERIGRYANTGDKSGVRRGVLDLVEKLDVSSPADGTVLVMQPDPSASGSTGLLQQLAALPAGKQSIEMTQGGRVLGRLAPILGANGTFTGKDGMDRAWGRLTERFAQQARGQVDVIVAMTGGGPPMPGAPMPGAPPMPGAMPAAQAGGVAKPAVGGWTLPGDAPAPPQSAAPMQQPPPLGQWSVPGEGNAAAQGPIGQWTAPSNSPAATGPAAEIGKWTVGSPGPDPSSAAPGQWVLPDQAGGAQLTGGADKAVGQWQVPGTANDPANLPVGQWIQPDAAGNAQLADAAGKGLGQWNVPGTPSDPANLPVGQWVQPDAAGNAQLSGGADQGVGQWKVPGAASDPGSGPVGQWVQPDAQGGTKLTGGTGLGQWETTGGAGKGAAVGSWNVPKDLPLGNGVNLSDVIRQNPNISGVRLVELVPGSNPQQPSRLVGIANAARSLLTQRFGLK